MPIVLPVQIVSIDIRAGLDIVYPCFILPLNHAHQDAIISTVRPFPTSFQLYQPMRYEIAAHHHQRGDGKGEVEIHLALQQNREEDEKD